MVAVFAREVLVNGKVYPPGHRADTVDLREDRYHQMVNLKRIVDSDDPENDNRWPTPSRQPGELVIDNPGGQVLAIADAQGNITGGVPIPDASMVTPATPQDGTDLEGLWPCRVEDCSRRLGSERGRDNHESREH